MKQFLYYLISWSYHSDLIVSFLIRQELSCRYTLPNTLRGNAYLSAIYSQLILWLANLFQLFPLQPTNPKRNWLVFPFGANPWWIYLVSSVPAILVIILIFMDQQITAVILNRKEYKLQVSIWLGSVM